jgi:hypothetical protein
MERSKRTGSKDSEPGIELEVMPQPVKARVWGMLMKSDVLSTTCVRAPYVSIRQHTSAYVRIREHTCASTTWVRVALGSSILHMLYVRKIHLERNVCV